ncbi:MAG: carboxypeptidase regulatory-like domain-containing protein [Actinobacteria bacterium]|nr:carboxypeptidase regulatory-like domain-containing protein [Actinomycetota bacterium]
MARYRGRPRHVTVVVALTIAIVASVVGMAHAAGAGSPDPSWGTDGMSEPVPYRYVRTHDVLVAPDGGVYFATSTSDYDGTSSWIDRYTSSGALDTTFPRVTLGYSGTARMEVQDAASGYGIVAVERGHLVRLTPAGDRDPTFAGPSRTALRTSDVEVSATGERIVTLGTRGLAAGYGASVPLGCGWPCPYLGAFVGGGAGVQVVSAYDRNGHADPGFSGGEVALGSDGAYAMEGGPCALVTCVYVGVYVDGDGQPAVCVVLVCTPRAGISSDFSATDVTLDPNGGVFVGGSVRDPRQGGTRIPVVVHLLADGSLDDSFGDHGVLLGHDGWARGEVVAVEVDRDGRLLAVNRTCESRCVHQAVRLLGDQLDPAFGGGVVPLPGWGTMRANVVEAPDGKLLLFRSGYGLTRLTSDGALDATFGTDGEVLGGAGRGAVDHAGRSYLSNRDAEGYVRVVRLLGDADGGTVDPIDPALSGTVSDHRTGAPIAGAMVDCVDAVGVTDTAGAYRIELPPATYTCTASAPGYASKKRRVTVSDTGATADFALRST